MGAATLLVVDVVLLVGQIVAGLYLGILRAGWWTRLVRRRALRAARRASPGSRCPIEELAARARRLGTRYHCAPTTQAYARIEGIRQAYDESLQACCAAVEIDCLLGVLTPGPELDLERRRVEYRLENAGLVLNLPAY